MIGKYVYYFFSEEELLEDTGTQNISEIEFETIVDFVINEGNSIRMTQDELEYNNKISDTYDSYIKLQVIESGEINHSYTLKPIGKKKK